MHLIDLFEQSHWKVEKILSLKQTHEHITKLHSKSYEEQLWNEISWKWKSDTQIIIADFLDLLCGGITTLLPDNFNKWQDQEKLHVLWAKSIETNKLELVNLLLKKLESINIIYETEANKRNLGDELENL